MLKVSEFILPDKRWDILKLSQIILASILPHVLAVPIPLTNVLDTFCWGLTGSGEFSVKSATYRPIIILVLTHLHGSLSGYGSWMSCRKFKSFLANCVTMHSPLGATYCVEVYILILFPVCLSHIEDNEHLFALCSFTIRVWDLATKYGWICQAPFATLQHTVRDVLHEWYMRCRATMPRIVVLLWSIWKSCNSLVLQNALSNPMYTLIRAKHS